MSSNKPQLFSLVMKEKEHREQKEQVVAEQFGANKNVNLI